MANLNAPDIFIYGQRRVYIGATLDADGLDEFERTVEVLRKLVKPEPQAAEPEPEAPDHAR